jgi:hypothetical protein
VFLMALGCIGWLNRLTVEDVQNSRLQARLSSAGGGVDAEPAAMHPAVWPKGHRLPTV